jgi:small subunit ribosomal protein S5
MENKFQDNRRPGQGREQGRDGRRGGQDNRVRRTFGPGEGSQQYDYEVLDVARVVRVVKGGRRFSFRASVVVGDRAGLVGLGMGKSRDVQNAIEKAYGNGAKNMQKVLLQGKTIVHEVRAKFNGSEVMLKPARPGTGVIAGGTVRLMADLSGIHDLVSKRLGSANKVNTARATLQAMSNLQNAPVRSHRRETGKEADAK